MAYHADDDGPGSLTSTSNLLADGILIWPVLPGKILINDGDGLRADPVAIREDAALEQRNADGGEVARSNVTNIPPRTGTARRLDAAFYAE